MLWRHEHGPGPVSSSTLFLFQRNFSVALWCFTDHVRGTALRSECLCRFLHTHTHTALRCCPDHVRGTVLRGRAARYQRSRDLQYALRSRFAATIWLRCLRARADGCTAPTALAICLSSALKVCFVFRRGAFLVRPTFRVRGRSVDRTALAARRCLEVRSSSRPPRFTRSLGRFGSRPCPAAGLKHQPGVVLPCPRSRHRLAALSVLPGWAVSCGCIFCVRRCSVQRLCVQSLRGLTDVGGRNSTALFYASKQCLQDSEQSWCWKVVAHVPSSLAFVSSCS